MALPRACDFLFTEKVIGETCLWGRWQSPRAWKIAFTLVSVYLSCTQKLFDVHEKTRLTCVRWIRHIFLSAALNLIACTSIQLIFFLNKTVSQNPRTERSEVSAKLSCVAQISLCSCQSVMGRKKIEQRLYILS